MIKRKSYVRHRPDLVSEELIAALLERKATFEFNDLFLTIYEKLRARNATSGGQEMLRLRAYERLQMLVAQGLVARTGKTYSANRAALRIRSDEMVAAKSAAEQRRASVLHPE